MNILCLDGRYFNAYLERLGHHVLHAGTANPGTDRDLQCSRPITALELFETAKARGFAPDAVLWCDICRPPTVIGLETLPVATIGYSIDQYVNPWHKPYSAAFDTFFVAQKDSLPLFAHKDLPRPVAWMPLFYDPDTTQIDPNLARDIPVSFVGTLDGPLNTGRKSFLQAFNTLCPLTTATGDFRPVYARSRIVLNQSAAGELNFRIFEAAALGAAVLTEDVTAGLHDIFSPNENILPPYPRGDAAGAAAIAKAFLNDPERLAAVAAHGRRLVAAHHSASARARFLAQTAAEHVAGQTWRARLANRAAIRAETAKCYVFLATDEALGIPLEHRQAYLQLAQTYLAG
jgi:hypothetical protein